MSEFAPFLLNQMFWTVNPRQFAAMQIQHCFRDYLNKKRMMKIVNTIQSCAKTNYSSPKESPRKLKKPKSQQVAHRVGGSRRARRRNRRR